ncbi:unnamed protein product [Phytophthora lilii]|uniref:Unnamed protein product n=1 Tax=Phytophthora lilii TaxID=2077276 RepID=A0A9W6XHJ7_9STRA|nr:unnamed protein product [Phytophthora lilii]
MDWLKKKKEEAKQAAAKISNKRSAFRGEGNVLGGGDAAAAPAAAPAARGSSLKAKALEQRGNAWEKRVATARKARLQQEEERENKFQYAEPLPPSAASDSAPAGPPPSVLSNEEVKARELHSAHQQMGFNPYAATFSSSTQAVSAMNAIGAGGSAPPPPVAASCNGGPPPAPFPAIPQVAAPNGALTSSDAAETGAVYVLLRQDPARAITAAETLIKMLSNIVKNPESKLVPVPGAINILTEAGFSRIELDGEVYLMLTADEFQAERVQSAIDRTEVALIQLQHDSAVGGSAPPLPAVLEGELVGLAGMFGLDVLVAAGLVAGPGLLALADFIILPLDESGPPTSPTEGPDPDPDALTEPPGDLPQRCKRGSITFAYKRTGPIVHSLGATCFTESIALMHAVLLQTASICALVAAAMDAELYPESARQVLTFPASRSLESAVVLHGAAVASLNKAAKHRSKTTAFIGAS